MLSMRISQVLFIFIGIIALFNGLDKINTDFSLGIAYFSLFLACTSIMLGFESIIQGNKSTRIARKSRDIANESKTIALESRNRMETIGYAEIQQCIINIESIRKEYFYGIQEYLLTPAANRTIVNISHLQQINIFSTWFNFQNIEKALIYRDYMSDEQRLRLFGLHRLLLDNILPNWEHQIVSNESIHQLLMGINILYGHLEDNNNFHEQFYEILNEYVGWIEPEEEFLEYINRIDRKLRERDLLNLFEPFQ